MLMTFLCSFYFLRFFVAKDQKMKRRKTAKKITNLLRMIEQGMIENTLIYIGVITILIWILLEMVYPPSRIKKKPRRKVFDTTRRIAHRGSRVRIFFIGFHTHISSIKFTRSLKHTYVMRKHRSNIPRTRSRRFNSRSNTMPI